MDLSRHLERRIFLQNKSPLEHTSHFFLAVFGMGHASMEDHSGEDISWIAGCLAVVKTLSKKEK
jgi:hypothetical protein